MKLCRRMMTAMLLSALILIGACVRRGADQEGAELTAGDPARGRVAIVRYGCGACHAIPGVSNAKGLVGPPLSGIANRAYIGGVLGNTPDNMIEWLRNPQAVSPKTAMPNLHVSERDARDIASYLYTLK